jgi:GNAT superfamily N-acetyltransferase
MLDDVRIRPIDLTDAGEVFTLQRAAFIEEAHLYETVDTPALTQTFDELKAELTSNSGCVALVGSRMVGSVTARIVGDVLRIGRLAVVPDMQGRGIGTRLLETVEARSDAVEAELFTLAQRRQPPPIPTPGLRRDTSGHLAGGRARLPSQATALTTVTVRWVFEGSNGIGFSDDCPLQFDEDPCAGSRLSARD